MGNNKCRISAVWIRSSDNHSAGWCVFSCLDGNYCAESLHKGRVNMAEHVGTGLNPQAPWSVTLFTQAANLGPLTELQNNKLYKYWSFIQIGEAIMSSHQTNVNIQSKFREGAGQEISLINYLTSKLGRFAGSRMPAALILDQAQMCRSSGTKPLLAPSFPVVFPAFFLTTVLLLSWGWNLK